MQFRQHRQTQLEINDGRLHMTTIGDDLVRLRGSEPQLTSALHVDAVRLK